MEPAPAVRNRGSGPTLILSVTLLVFGSTRLTRLFSVLLTHTALSSPKTHENEPDGTSISADTVFVGPFVTQTESSVITCQSGVPSIGNTATGVIEDIER